MELKFAPFCSSRDALSVGTCTCTCIYHFLAKSKFSDFDGKPWTMFFFFASQKKVVRKVYHLKANGKRNLMALVSVA